MTGAERWFLAAKLLVVPPNFLSSGTGSAYLSGPYGALTRVKSFLVEVPQIASLRRPSIEHAPHSGRWCQAQRTAASRPQRDQCCACRECRLRSAKLTHAYELLCESTGRFLWWGIHAINVAFAPDTYLSFAPAVAGCREPRSARARRCTAVDATTSLCPTKVSWFRSMSSSL